MSACSLIGTPLECIRTNASATRDDVAQFVMVSRWSRGCGGRARGEAVTERHRFDAEALLLPAFLRCGTFLSRPPRARCPGANARVEALREGGMLRSAAVLEVACWLGEALQLATRKKIGAEGAGPTLCLCFPDVCFLRWSRLLSGGSWREAGWGRTKR